ncbi:uncharacterized protein LOC103516038 isoform X1 [Diaphorina citri]|uniref:Uncharacterized protein LOC103516038 isoform X1 n=1 Tax=Diaphorina citri TaxID=121845 RepID=A0A1S3DCV9_DIACI|nr:uncharacterized protein LOC103516038 isoform X2 [Diaphorina citri]XP_026684358.1 uncharacterized protein LOC103516038 isoform X1 [Diaphorina citri]XP_026684359.1 uncharacterized protein LOC103516038 isoform X1 [Diaphorina citri]KAI5699674.1 hypothetical protein M8J75_006767 [Diaphorina citri]KAI5730916.1 hypothetical protein M8J77_002039 [Diaphorina citri]
MSGTTNTLSKVSNVNPRLTQFVLTPPSQWKSAQANHSSSEAKANSPTSSCKQSSSDFDYENLLVQIEFEQVIEKTLEELQEQAQQRRLKDLRKELDFVKRTEWRYTPIEKLLGFDVTSGPFDKKE